MFSGFGSLTTFTLLMLAWIAAICGLLAIVYRRTLAAAWREPVLTAPVMILESDDWGYGPVEQARALTAISDLLASFRDANGAHPVMTLGIVLAGPDPERTQQGDCSTYFRTTIADPPLIAVRDAMLEGTRRGVFALQLHGMEHFWPASLLRSARSDASVRAWLGDALFPRTEALPSALQSRWIDATELPSKPLPREDAIDAAHAEARAFAQVFGVAPVVAVPPTFVWPTDVEAAWARAGVRVVVTPGYRSDRRDKDGKIVPGDRLLALTKASTGVLYMVRDCYFEPALGHTHERALGDIAERTWFGRPALIEIHRMNFIGDSHMAQETMGELRKLLERAVAIFPTVHFMSTASLAETMSGHSPLVDRRFGARVHAMIRRIAAISRLRKLGWLTGVAIPVVLAYAATWPWRCGGTRSMA